MGKISETVKLVGVSLTAIACCILVSPTLALSHPGKTDRNGGHKCWKGCAEWELYHGEYHLHDKDFRPIRITGKENPHEIKEPTEVPVEAAKDIIPAVPEKAFQEKQGNVKKPKVISLGPTVSIYDESICSFSLVQLALFAAVIFLLVVLLLIQVRRHRKTP